jgi:hypothetical protein
LPSDPRVWAASPSSRSRIFELIELSAAERFFEFSGLVLKPFEVNEDRLE